MNEFDEINSFITSTKSTEFLQIILYGERRHEENNFDCNHSIHEDTNRFDQSL